MKRFRASRALMACVFGVRRMLSRYEQTPRADVSNPIVPMACAERSSHPCSGRPCRSNRAVGTALVAGGLALALVSGAARGQERPSLDVTLEWLRTKIPLAKHVDAQGDRWEWQPVAMDGCDIRLRETIHASDGPLVTEYAIRLGELRKTVTVGQWIWFYTREPTILATTYLRIGDPSIEPVDSFFLRFPDTSLVTRVQRAMRNATSWCRAPSSKEPF